MNTAGNPVRLSVIVPATNHPPTLDAVLQSIRGADSPPEELIVVDDRSIKHPGTARNVGARQATGDVLVFIDADVTIHSDALRRLRDQFNTDPTLTAVLGSYDDAPTARTVVSVFRNLLHHYVHHQNAGPASTFWAGLGAIRRGAFEEAGGFVEHPIEDIELGMRLSQQGKRLIIDPAIQGTHLKRWTLASMVRTDLFVRGIPWVGLLLRFRDSPSTVLNLSWAHRLSALSSFALLVALLFAGAGWLSIWFAVAALGMLIALNYRFYLFLARREGIASAIAGIFLHWIHHLVSVAAVPLGMLRYHAEQRTARARIPAT